METLLELNLVAATRFWGPQLQILEILFEIKMWNNCETKSNSVSPVALEDRDTDSWCLSKHSVNVTRLHFISVGLGLKCPTEQHFPSFVSLAFGSTGVFTPINIPALHNFSAGPAGMADGYKQVLLISHVSHFYRCCAFCLCHPPPLPSLRSCAL